MNQTKIKGIEERMVDKELASLECELRKASEIIHAAMSKYLAPGNTTYDASEMSAIAKDFNSAMRDFLSVGYYAGHYLSAGLPFNAPKSIRPLIASYCADELLRRLDAVEDLAGDAMNCAESARRD